MAESKRLLCVLLLAVLLRGALLQTNSTICPTRSYSIDPSGQQCYRYIESPKDFFAANRTCDREGGAMLLRIDSARENKYVRARFFVGRGSTEFWIGLNDIDQEGVFRWVDGDEAVYTNWSQSFPPATENDNNWDCVKFAADGWRLHRSGCAVSDFPFVCKMRPCQSRDGNVCIGSEPTMVAQRPDVGLIVGIVVVVFVIVAVVVLVIVLLLMWKFANDAFHRYTSCCMSGRSCSAMHHRFYCFVCFCVSGESQSAVHSLQLENQQLRHELSQHNAFFGASSRVIPITSPFPPSKSFTTPSVFTAVQQAHQGTKVSLQEN